jgi:hypothetical protein
MASMESFINILTTAVYKKISQVESNDATIL